jgi:hypothetical protein
MIRDCDHPNKAVVGGTRMRICRSCREENIRAWAATDRSSKWEGSQEPHPPARRKKTYVYRDLHAPSMPEHDDGWIGE